jgi:hypothetical protein
MSIFCQKIGFLDSWQPMRVRACLPIEDARAWVSKVCGDERFRDVCVQIPGKSAKIANFIQILKYNLENNYNYYQWITID